MTLSFYSTNVFILGCCSHRNFSGKLQPISKMSTLLILVIHVLHLLWATLLVFVLLDPENWAKVNLAASTHYTNGCLQCSRNTLKLRNGNDVVTYFRSAANGVHATAATADYTFTK